MIWRNIFSVTVNFSFFYTVIVLAIDLRTFSVKLIKMSTYVEFLFSCYVMRIGNVLSTWYTLWHSLYDQFCDIFIFVMANKKTHNLLSSSHFYDAVSRNAIGLSLIINTNMLHYIVFVCICILPIISRKRQLGSTTHLLGDVTYNKRSFILHFLLQQIYQPPWSFDSDDW